MLKGSAELIAALSVVGAKLPDAVASALYAEGILIEGKSKQRAPVDTGALRASHYTAPPDRSGRDITVTISVGGPAAPYAAIVHEDLLAHHTVGENKFLEKSIMEAKRGMPERIVKRVLGGF